MTGTHILLLLLIIYFRREMGLEQAISSELDKILKINQEEDEQVWSD